MAAVRGKRPLAGPARPPRLRPQALCHCRMQCLVPPILQDRRGILRGGHGCPGNFIRLRVDQAGQDLTGPGDGDGTVALHRDIAEPDDRLAQAWPLCEAGEAVVPFQHHRGQAQPAVVQQAGEQHAQQRILWGADLHRGDGAQSADQVGQTDGPAGRAGPGWPAAPAASASEAAFSRWNSAVSVRDRVGVVQGDPVLGKFVGSSSSDRPSQTVAPVRAAQMCSRWVLPRPASPHSASRPLGQSPVRFSQANASEFEGASRSFHCRIAGTAEGSVGLAAAVAARADSGSRPGQSLERRRRDFAPDSTKRLCLLNSAMGMALRNSLYQAPREGGQGPHQGPCPPSLRSLKGWIPKAVPLVGGPGGQRPPGAFRAEP